MKPTLAIDGGPPVRTSPMPTWPAPGDEEIAEVTAVLRSGRLNYWTGEEGRLLEAEYAQTLGRDHAIALANGTVALELALRAFGIGPGSEVVVPARTFIATAGAVVAVGAVPIVCDIDTDNGGMTAAAVSAVLSERTRAVIPVHVGGWPVDLDPILDLARRHDLVVIEDCAQAHGGMLDGRPVGSLGSHAAAFSFCQDKIVPAGEGGLLVLDDQAAYERAWAYKENGKSLPKTVDPSFSRWGTSFVWLVDTFGTNWRMPETSAAIVRVGLHKLPSWHAARRRNALQLAEGIRDLGALRVPVPSAATEHAFYRLYAYVRPETLADGWDRDRITSAIQAEGVACQYGTSAEIYREEAFAAAGLAPSSRLPGAAAVHETSIAFYVHPTLTSSDMDDTVVAVHKVLEAASK